MSNASIGAAKYPETDISASADMAAYDALPAPIRHKLANSSFDFCAFDCLQSFERTGSVSREIRRIAKSERLVSAAMEGGK